MKIFILLFALISLIACQQWSFYMPSEPEVRLETRSVHQKRTECTDTFTKAIPKNRRDLLRTYMGLISYLAPLQNNGKQTLGDLFSIQKGIPLDVQLRAEIRDDLNASGVLNHFTKHFVGNDAGASQGNPLSQLTRIGVAYGVWANPFNQTVTVIYPGTYSNYDLTADFAIWGKSLAYVQAENGLKRYKKFDLPEQYLRPRDPVRERFSTNAFKAIWPGIRQNFTEELRLYTNLTVQESLQVLIHQYVCN